MTHTVYHWKMKPFIMCLNKLIYASNSKLIIMSHYRSAQESENEYPTFGSDLRGRKSDVQIFTFRLSKSDVGYRILLEVASRKSDVDDMTHTKI